MPRIPLAFSAILFGATAAAQLPTVTLVTASPIVGIANSPTGGLVQQSLPANTTGNQILFLAAGSGTSLATWTLQSVVSPTDVLILWEHPLSVPEAAPSFASGDADAIVWLSASNGTAVNIELSRVITATPGASTPACSIDIRNDGIVEFTELSPATMVVQASIGPQLLPIRMRSAVTLAGPGFSGFALRLRVTPVNGVLIGAAGPGCAGINQGLQVWESWVGGGVQFGVATTYPGLLVLGLAPQPQLMPAPFHPQCLLLPSPDVLLGLPATVGGVTVPLPAAVRPLDLWAQGAFVMPTELGLSNAVWVQAF